MPLNITAEARPDTPGLVVDAAAPGAVAQAQSVAPAPVAGISASVMPPVAKAGVNLAYVVLTIAAGSILLLLVFLTVMEFHVPSELQTVYGQILNPNRIGSEFYALGRLEKFSLDLAAAKDPHLQTSQDSVQNAESVVAMLKQLPSVTATQKAQLADCLSVLRSPPAPADQPADTARAGKLDRCLAVVELVRQAALEAATGATNAQVAGEFATKINEHRQTLQTFWIQAAQLLLLNLLLPLLTALFGYIFGTQQAQRTS